MNSDNMAVANCAIGPPLYLLFTRTISLFWISLTISFRFSICNLRSIYSRVFK